MDIHGYELSSLVPTLDIAADAFFPQKKAIPEFLDMSKLRNMCFCAFWVCPHWIHSSLQECLPGFAWGLGDFHR